MLEGAGISLLAVLLLAGYVLLFRWVDRIARGLASRTVRRLKDKQLSAWLVRHQGRSRTAFIRSRSIVGLLTVCCLCWLAGFLFGAWIMPGIGLIWILWRNAGHTWDARTAECNARGLTPGAISEIAVAPPGLQVAATWPNTALTGSNPGTPWKSWIRLAGIVLLIVICLFVQGRYQGVSATATGPTYPAPAPGPAVVHQVPGITPAPSNPRFAAMEAETSAALGVHIPGLPYPADDDGYRRFQLQCQMIAKKYFPDLGVAGSPLNLQFIALYQQHKAAPGKFFTDPDWPIRLLEESVLAPGTRPLRSAPTQSPTAAVNAAEQAFAAEGRKRVDAAYTTYPSLRDRTSLLCATANAVFAEYQADPKMAALMKTPEAPDEIVRTAVHRTATKLVEQGKFPDYESALASLKAATAAQLVPSAVNPPQ